MESWRKVWRDGFLPQFSPEQRAALKQALETDDPRLLQGATTQPPPLMCVQDWTCEGGCAVSFCGMPGTVGEVEEFFAAKCFQADQLLGEPAACRWFLNWFDDTPRDKMRRLLLEELQ